MRKRGIRKEREWKSVQRERNTRSSLQKRLSGKYTGPAVCGVRVDRISSGQAYPERIWIYMKYHSPAPGGKGGGGKVVFLRISVY